MPFRRLLTEGGAFDPDAIEGMTEAYDHLCVALHLADHDGHIRELVAKKIIEHAQQGEKDALALAQLVLKDLRQTSP